MDLKGKVMLFNHICHNIENRHPKNDEVDIFEASKKKYKIQINMIKFAHEADWNVHLICFCFF